ncbi:MAG: flagellar hook-basal body complex protein, partial [Bryobacteraceae bacterium]
NGSLDAAISGDGFFVVKDQQNQTLYTRAGNFRMDAQGNLLTASGENVQGWSAVNGKVSASGAIGNISLPVSGAVPATVTTKMSMNVNLNAGATVGDAATGTFSTPVQVVDSLGNTHILTATFTKTDANKWEYKVEIPKADLKDGGATELSTGSLAFDATGFLSAPAATDAPIDVKIAGLVDGAADQTVAWSMWDSGSSAITQFAQTSAMSSVTQDGAEAGEISSIALKNGGAITAHFSNGQDLVIGQLAVASIRNPESLVGVGNNNLKSSTTTGEAAIGEAASGGRGKIVGGALEASTIDIAREFTSLLTMQRSYQANSKVITTSDDMMQQTIAMIR